MNRYLGRKLYPMKQTAQIQVLDVGLNIPYGHPSQTNRCTPMMMPLGWCYVDSYPLKIRVLQDQFGPVATAVSENAIMPKGIGQYHHERST